MLQFFRNIFKTKLGVLITLAFVGLLGLAFVVGDVANTGGTGGLAGDENVAVVGDAKIGVGDFSNAATTALERVRQQDPTQSMASFVATGGLDGVLDQMIDRRAISEWAQDAGLRAGANLVNAEIRSIPAFAGVDGQFSDTVYRQALAQRSLSDSVVRQEIADGFLAQQALVPAAFGAKMPRKLALRYLALTREKRDGAVAMISSAAFAPTAAPTATQLAAFYQANQRLFIRPERRVLRYFSFGEAAIGNVAATEAEIAARYKANQATVYAAREERGLTQLIVPTRQAAEAIARRGGAALDAAAREAGLEPATVAPIDRAKLAAQSSQAVADAVFAAGRGQIATPARGGLGYYVVRVDSINRTPARTLDQVRGEIASALTTEKRARAFAELAADIEDQLDGGASLSDAAAAVNATVATTKPLVADGRVYGSTEPAPEVLRPALAAAFEMEEGQPQVAPGADGKSYLVFETQRTTPSAPAPLAEIRDDVILAWRRDEGAKAARAAADRIVARIGKGQTLAAAMAAEKVSLPAPDAISMTRAQLSQQGQRVPPPLALLFSMAKNSVKRLEAPGKAGWYVVTVNSIVPGQVAANDPLLAQAGPSLGQLQGRELSDALRAAIRSDVGVERNAAAVAAVRKQLTGSADN